MEVLVGPRLVLICLVVAVLPSSALALVIKPINQTSQKKSDGASNELSEVRPFYNIAHMCNSIARTVASLERGANAIEVDVTFHPHDIILYHGFPCDCFRFCWHWELLDTYLKFARETTTPGHPKYDPRFVLLYFDVKLDGFPPTQKYEQGVRFGRHLVSHFLVPPVMSELKLVVSVMWATDVDFLRGLIQHLRQLDYYDAIEHQIGYDVGQDFDMANIESMWSFLNVSNLWQGEGITNCVSHLFDNRPEHLIKRRDRNRAETYYHKVYSWTVDRSEAIKSALGLGIDGLMTNLPDRVNRILDEPEFRASFRLATASDDPFRKVPLGDGHKHRHRRSFIHQITSTMRDVTESAYYFAIELLQVTGLLI